MNPLCKGWDAKKDGPIPAVVCDICREEHGGRCPLEKRGGLAAVFVAAMILWSCGGGDGNGPAPPGREFLTWAPPTAFTDNEALDPARDLSHYEVFASSSGNWDNEVPAVIVAAVDNTGAPAMELALDALRSVGVSPDNGALLVTIRAVSIHDKASAYGVPALWEGR